MQLRYRGTAYETSSFVANTTQAEITGQYRGTTTTIRLAPAIVTSRIATTLHYRGASYTL